MPLLPRRFERLRSVLKGRMADLTVLMEAGNTASERRWTHGKQVLLARPMGWPQTSRWTAPSGHQRGSNAPWPWALPRDDAEGGHQRSRRAVHRADARPC